jgi:hypothetical protein
MEASFNMELNSSSENKMSETFDNFGEGPKEENLMLETVNLVGEVIDALTTNSFTTSILQEIPVNLDYESMEIEEIIKKYNFEIIPKEEVQPNFTQVYVHNKFHKFYLAKCSKLGPCSMIVLNDVENKKTQFGTLLANLSKINSEINIRTLLKVKGITIRDKQVFLIFEPILTSYKNKVLSNQVNDINLKYITIFYLIELMCECHSKQIGLQTLRPSTLLYNNVDEFRYLITFRKYIYFLIY